MRQSFTYFWIVSNFLILFLDRKNVFDKPNINGEVLLVGNFIIYVATALSFWVSRRSFKSANPNASVRSLYGSFMIKFFLIAIAAFVYIMIERKNLNKSALMICMGLYLIYSFLEVAAMQKLLRQRGRDTALKNQ